FVYSYDNPEINRRFADWLEEISPDVVHLTSCYAFGAGILCEAPRPPLPTFLTLTHFSFTCPRPPPWPRDRRLCDGPENALTCQKCMAAGSGLFQKLTKVVPPGVAVRGFLAASHHPSLARLRGLRGYVGDADARLAVLRDLFELVDVPIAPSRFLRD